MIILSGLLSLHYPQHEEPHVHWISKAPHCFTDVKHVTNKIKDQWSYMCLMVV